MNCIISQRLLKPIKFAVPFRLVSQLTQKLSYVHLSNKSILEVKGSDASDFLQGLITNDMRHLDDGIGHGRCLLSFCLNPSGRILADVMIYKTDNEGTSFLMECDSQVSSRLLKHLVTHKLRKKLSISLNSNTKVYSVFPSNLTLDDDVSGFKRMKANEVINDTFMLVNDIRLPVSLYRLITLSHDKDVGGEDVSRVLSQAFNQPVNEVEGVSLQDYTSFRYRIGLSEGLDDHPFAACFPLESNGDFLHAISFFKGCYIGQELTARTYHTGVVRKRLMPVTLPENHVPVDTEFKGSDETRVGRLRSVSGTTGLALLYVEKVTRNRGILQYGDSKREGISRIPFWWPNVNKV